MYVNELSGDLARDVPGAKVICPDDDTVLIYVPGDIPAGDLITSASLARSRGGFVRTMVPTLLGWLVIVDGVFPVLTGHYAAEEVPA